MNWTPEDKARAYKEGWKLMPGGSIAPVYTDTGELHFQWIPDVYEWIIQQATKGSEWHQRVLDSQSWSAAFNMLTRREGWTIDQWNGVNRIRAIVANFPGDPVEYVTRRASNGSLLHIKALNYVTRKRLLQDQ